MRYNATIEKKKEHIVKSEKYVQESSKTQKPGKIQLENVTARNLSFYVCFGRVVEHSVTIIVI